MNLDYIELQSALEVQVHQLFGYNLANIFKHLKDLKSWN